MRNDVNAATNDLKNQKRAAESNIRDAAGHIRAGAANVQDNLRGFAYEAGQRVNDYITTGRERFDTATEDYADRVRERPLQTSLIVLGVGLLLGAFMNRR